MQELQQAASNGKEDQQLLLGRYYLRLADLAEDDDSAKHAKQGVDWLVKSSKQGNEEATSLLRECLENKQGKYLYFFHLLV